MNNEPILITHRHKKGNEKLSLILELTAEERTKLRGRRTTKCGVELLLQLPREGKLMPGELLLGVNHTPKIIVAAAIENLMKIKATSKLELLKAVYHLGNRHVEMELHEEEIYLSQNHVLKKMLLQMGLSVKNIQKSFYPEHGAYSPNHSN